jgi:hypothetical protein
MSKSWALLLVAVLTVSSLLMVASAFAQSIPKPSVPEFTLQLEDNWWVRVIVQNQPIIPNGHDSAWIFYATRYKWHESTNWYPTESISNDGKYVGEMGTSGTTEWVISTNSFYELLGMTTSHQLDYQILAINGYKNTTLPYDGPPIGVEPGDYPVVIVNTSGWSNTQTITIPESQTPMPSPATTPTSPPTSSPPPTPYSGAQLTEQEIIIGVAIIAVVIGAGLALLIYLIKRK